MNQPCELKIFPSSGPCQHRVKRKKRCRKPSYARLDGGTPRCKTHLEDQMDYIENVSRKEKKDG
jgi:hypothetical protein